MRALKFIGYCLAAGVLMAAFILLSGFIRYLFSLGAILVGVRFFRLYESKGARIGFIAAAVLLSLFLPLVYVAFALAYGWKIDPKYLEGVQPCEKLLSKYFEDERPRLAESFFANRSFNLCALAQFNFSMW